MITSPRMATAALRGRAARELAFPQAARFDKMYTDEFFLLRADPPTGDGGIGSGSSTGTAALVRRTFTVSGSTRNTYVVTLYATGKLFCTCPDMRSHCTRHGCVCKHVCFVLVRVLAYTGMQVYEDLRVPASKVTAMLQRVVVVGQASDDLGLAGDACGVSTAILTRLTASDGLFAPLKFGDDCPICYDLIGEQSTTAPVVGCPDCKNSVHKRCMAKWMQSMAASGRPPTCVFCRSAVWKTYRMGLSIGAPAVSARRHGGM